MRKLNAVVRPSRLSSDKVKRQVPMFDKLLVIGLEHFFCVRRTIHARNSRTTSRTRDMQRERTTAKAVNAEISRRVQC
jgi:hypothetical protein